ncbi:MAG: hypothetical protein L0226_04270 [Acidobacteria bacterium]|nr:hypothetical protein [Acidobacteriota bacterium]
MTFEEFEASLTSDQPPAILSPYLTALWHEKRDDWKTAHEIVQDISDRNAARVHAYLHRREGDEGNARYWYGQANEPFPSGQSLEEEWKSLANSFLSSL